MAQTLLKSDKIAKSLSLTTVTSHRPPNSRDASSGVMRYFGISTEQLAVKVNSFLISALSDISVSSVRDKMVTAAMASCCLFKMGAEMPVRPGINPPREIAYPC